MHLRNDEIMRTYNIMRLSKNSLHVIDVFMSYESQLQAGPIAV